MKSLFPISILIAFILLSCDDDAESETSVAPTLTKASANAITSYQTTVDSIYIYHDQNGSITYMTLKSLHDNTVPDKTATIEYVDNKIYIIRVADNNTAKNSDERYTAVSYDGGVVTKWKAEFEQSSAQGSFYTNGYIGFDLSNDKKTTVKEYIYNSDGSSILYSGSYTQDCTSEDEIAIMIFNL